MVRITSSLEDDSTRITVAPMSARVLVAPGPASAHIKSSTLTPSKGKVVFFDSVTRPFSGTREISSIISSVCSPMRGGRRPIDRGFLLNLAKGPGYLIEAASPSPSGFIKYSRSANCSLATTSAIVVIGASNNRLSIATSSNSAFVFEAVQAATHSLTLSNSSRDSSPVDNNKPYSIQSLSRVASSQKPCSKTYSINRRVAGPTVAPKTCVIET